ncbi:GAF domain-containing protein [Streptacidiphilus fuscans]|uniref:GAF domain-containing protein n=1 Tax=Streptacidiphilus fuscans TaxID=2789292 RepID=A0A931FEJ5_9ACTN|nr:GAF domain-containing protein [Streptacidiphilus fuscans]MBF9071837.1 GAF domain-containing protein [Streptacidiphilus fuscans]
MPYDSAIGLHLPATADRDPELAQRRQVLRDLGLDLLESDPDFDAFATDLAGEVGLPFAMVNIVTDAQQFIGLHVPQGSDVPQVGRTMPRELGYCPDVVDRRSPLILPDVYAYPRFAGNPVVDAIGIRTYMGAPLVHTDSGTVIGTVCAVGPTERPLSTGRPSLAIIERRAEELMTLLNQPAPQPR